MEHFSTLLDNLYSVVYVADPATHKLLYINRYGRELFGADIGDACYNLFFDNPDHPCRFCPACAGQEKWQKPEIREIMDPKTGNWYQYRHSVIEWENQRSALLGTATKITEHKKREDQISRFAKLKERLLVCRSIKEKLDDISNTALTLFDTVFVGIWLFQEPEDLKKGYEDQEVLLLPVEDTKAGYLHLVSKSSKKKENWDELAEITIPRQPEREDWRSSEKKPLFATEHIREILCHQATKRGLYASCPFPLIDGEENTIGYMCFFNQAKIPPDEQQLMVSLVYTTSHIISAAATTSLYHKMNEKYLTLVDNIPHGVFFKDPSLRYASCNKQYAIGLGKTREDILGKTDFDLLPREIATSSFQIDKELMVSGKTRNDILEQIEDNKIRWIESIRTPVLDRKGNFSGVLGICRDITEVKLSQEKLQCLYNELEVITEARTEELSRTQEAYSLANNKLKLLNSVTRHDILNQITALYGYLELIKESVSDTSISQYLHKIEQSAETIQEQILFTRIYQDIGIFTPVWQSLKGSVEHILAGLKYDTVNISYSFHPVEVFADPLLEKVFYTLIDNSLRHGKTVTKISMNDEIRDDTLILRYEDNGVGILQDEKERIFDRGYGHNTGLGLFLAREIVQITGLSIRESGIPGKGVCFEITVPRNAYRFCPDISERHLII